jgi:hypothetical protein
MKNWKTTFFGALAAIMLILDGPVQQLAAGQPVDWLKVGFAIVVALIGYFAKDYNVSGSGAGQITNATK